MRRSVILAICLLAGLSGAGNAFGAQCGLPDAQPWWIDFSDGSVSFRNELFGRPGVIAATEGPAVSAVLRQRGAQTIYWDMHLERRVGTTATPADPAGVTANADALFDYAAASSSCATPLVALNELLGQTLKNPWTPENTAYRANVLAFVDEMAKRGARPFLLLPNSEPNLEGDGLLWWQRVAQSADLVRQVYFNAATISAPGPLLTSRAIRQRLRTAVGRLTAVGVAPAHLGLMVGFHSSGLSGRSGLPRDAWLEYVKLNALAAKQVAGELGVGSIWSWGWGTFDAAGADPDKPAAACVYLWARDQRLCDGLAAAGPTFDSSLTQGQIILAPGVQCSFPGGQFRSASLDAAAALTHDRQAAFSALLGRVVQRARAPVTSTEILAGERGVVKSRFSGSRSRYLAELRRRGITLDLARSVIADELRRQKLAPLTGGDVKAWTEGEGSKALDAATCLRDELPTPADVRLASYVRFLRLSPL